MSYETLCQRAGRRESISRFYVSDCVHAMERMPAAMDVMVTSPPQPGHWLQ